jgi:vancomycin resistance protein YoaR
MDIVLPYSLTIANGMCQMVSIGRNIGKRRLGLAMFALLMLVGAGLFIADQFSLNDPQILPNIHVANVDLGGLLPEDAEKKLKDSINAVPASPIMVTDKNAMWFIQPSDINFSIDVKRSVAAAYNVGREPNLIQRWKARLAAKEQPQILPVVVDLDRSKLAQALSALKVHTDRQPRDASIAVLVKTKSVTLIPAVEGRKLDVEQTAAQAFQLPQDHKIFVIDLVFDTQTPKITDEYFAGINTLLASFSTSFNPWDSERNQNLRLATRRIHGTVLKPGEIFSYNKNVGHRTQQEGFRMAPVILDGKLVPDWGGGVCQVSSTLYNAVLLADLDIVDRSNHGRAIGYVPLGFDATVVDGQIDFKFKNNLKSPVLIHSVVTDNELYFLILGDSKDAPPPIELDYVVHKVIEPVEIKQPDPTIEIGREEVDEPPQRGFRVSTYRIRTVNGKQVSQLLYTDDYDPVNRIVKVGTKPKIGGVPDPVVQKIPSDKQPIKTSAGPVTLQGQPSRPQTHPPAPATSSR